jgi:hypothetical protein
MFAVLLMLSTPDAAQSQGGTEECGFGCAISCDHEILDVACGFPDPACHPYECSGSCPGGVKYKCHKAVS